MLLAGPLLGQGCGDTQAQPRDGRERAETVPTARVADGPGPDAPALGPLALAGRLRAWQPTWSGSDDALLVVASAIREGCALAPWPDARRCEPVLGALLFRESSWRVGARGARGEIGLGQLHGAALQGRSRREAQEPATNVRLVLGWLHEAERVCRDAGWGGDPERVLGRYAGAGCVRTPGARRVLGWAAEIAERGGRS